MKSKVRRITVDDEQYVWSAVETEWDTVLIKVWAAGDKRSPWFSVEKSFLDPWLNFKELANGEMARVGESAMPVTPRRIASLVKEVKRRNYRSSANRPIQLKINSRGLLEEAS